MVKVGWTDNLDSKFKKCYGEFPDLDSWSNNLYQDKVFPTRAEFNAAYDRRDPLLHRKNQVVIITPEDLEKFKFEISEGEFEHDYSKLVKKIETLFECEKIVFFY